MAAAGAGAEGGAVVAPPSPASGLTTEEVEERRRNGLCNDVAVATSRPLSVILRTNIFTRFNAILGTLMAVIIVVGPFQDGLFAFILVLNTIIGIAQELRAKQTLDRLALISAPRVRVERDGAPVEVGPGELVVDDVIELQRGDQVPLDGVVLDGSLELDESLLTGEADPVARPPASEVRSGSFVSSGSGRYRVTRVGADSFAQQLTGEARRFAPARSELIDGVNRILRLVQWALIPTTALLIVSQLLSKSSLPDAVRGCVAGVGAMIPEGLVLLTSVTFAIGAVRLARRRVLVRELPAVEGLARVDVICVDKTGTLTRGGIVARGVDRIGPGDDPVEDALGALAGAEDRPNPTLAAIAARWPPPTGWEAGRMVAFSSARRWSGADFGARGAWVLGAPDVLLAGDPAAGVALGPTVERAAATGGRVVLLAAAPDGSVLDPSAPPPGLRPVALVRLAEQLREDAADTLAYLAREGVAVKVISGDHPVTVGAIAAAAGVPGADHPVDAASLSDAELGQLVVERSVFGRVAPRQKRAMVAALQGAGHTVAMTGDGVNDVLALKDADVGVAMGSGSAATRTVAQLVLLDDAFAAIPPVIAEGRRVMANVERVANLFLTKTAYATFIALAVGVTASPYPFLPRHLTIVSDFSIGIPAFFLALLPNSQRFRGGFVARVLAFSVPCGVVAATAALVAYFGVARSLPLTERRTVTTTVLVVCGLWVLALLSRPFTPFKATLVAAMAGCFAVMLAIAPVRRYFALQLPSAGRVAWGVVVIMVAGAGFEILYRGLRGRAGLAA